MTIHRYDVTYRTTIHYDDVVRASQNELRACPASDDHQQLVAYRVTTHPTTRVLSYQDYFGTRVDTFGIREPHVSLEITAEASVETLPRPLVTRVAPAAATSHESDVPRRARRVPRPHRAHRSGTATSRRPPSASPPSPGDDVVGIVLALHRFVHTSLRYTPGATYIGVDVNEVLAKAQGVCQDYAHLAVALCRSVGIPARYVSGLLLRRVGGRRAPRWRATRSPCRPTPGSRRRSPAGGGWPSTRPTPCRSGSATSRSATAATTTTCRRCGACTPAGGRPSTDAQRRDPPPARRRPAAPGPATAVTTAR